MRMIPSEIILFWDLAFLPLHEQLVTGLPQVGQILPDSVEYTSFDLSTVDALSQLTAALKRNDPS